MKWHRRQARRRRLAPTPSPPTDQPERRPPADTCNDCRPGSPCVFCRALGITTRPQEDTPR